MGVIPILQMRKLSFQVTSSVTDFVSHLSPSTENFLTSYQVMTATQPSK